MNGRLAGHLGALGPLGPLPLLGLGRAEGLLLLRVELHLLVEHERVVGGAELEVERAEVLDVRGKVDLLGLLAEKPGAWNYRVVVAAAATWWHERQVMVLGGGGVANDGGDGEAVVQG